MVKDYLKIEKIEIWARVGVLDEERKCGQLFNLDIFLWSDFKKCSLNDNLTSSIDYSLIISEVKSHAKDFTCLTIEKYSEEIIKLIENKFKPDCIKIILTKCRPPIPGFNGKVSIIKISEKE